MTDTKDYQRARGYIEKNVRPSDYKTFDDYTNACAREINWGYVKGDEPALVQMFRMDHPTLTVEEERNVHGQLGKVWSTDRQRRNEVWDWKYFKKEKMREKGLTKEEIDERMKELHPPKTLQKVPVIEPLPKKPEPFQRIERVVLLEPRIVTNKAGKSSRYYKYTRTHYPSRMYYFRRNGRLITWKNVPA